MVRLGYEIIDLSQFPRNRFVPDGRAVFYPTKEREKALLQIEWVNPHPEKPLVKVEFSAVEKDAPLVIGGLTLRGVR